MEREQGSTRRRFVNWLLGTSLGGLIVAVFYPIAKYIIPPKVGEASVANVKIPWKATEMKANSGRIFKFGSQPGILVKTPDGELRAFTAICTHLACTVQYREDMQMIWCACHNGHYDLFGKNVAGPPPRPLDPYKVFVKADEITVAKA